MRIWSGEGGLMTDEQLLAYIGHFGSLSRALECGDVRLVSDSKNEFPLLREEAADDCLETHRRLRETKLSDYL